MRHERLLTTIAQELPSLIRQLESGDLTLHAAAINRLRDFAQMLEPWRGAMAKRSSRREFARYGAITFAAMSLKADD